MPSTPAVEDVKLYVPQLTAAQDALLEKIEVRAQSIIDSYYRMKLGPGWPGFADYTDPEARLVYGWGTKELVLEPHRVGSVTAVTDVAWNSSGIPITSNPVTPATFQEDLENGWLIWPDYSWGRAPYFVTAEWGYGPMPEAVYQVKLELMINIWRGKDRTQDVEGNPVGFSTGLTDRQMAILDSVLQPWRVKYGTIAVHRAP